MTKNSNNSGLIEEKLGIDDKDVRIVTLLMKDPKVSQQEIAKNLGLSQPSVAVRISKLEKKGIISFSAGISFEKSKLHLVRVDFTSNNATATLEELKSCPFFVNGFLMSGQNNASIFLVGVDLVKIEEIINKHLRLNPQVSSITVNVIVSSAKDFVFQIDLANPAFCFEREGCAKCRG